MTNPANKINDGLTTTQRWYRKMKANPIRRAERLAYYRKNNAHRRELIRQGILPPRKKWWTSENAKRKLKKYAEQRRQLSREFVDALKDAPCMDCGAKYPPYVMDFDHVRGEKKYVIGSIKSSNGSLDRILAEVEKCDLICSNCHRERTYRKKLEKIHAITK